jgi:hypothetical protein
MHGTSKRIVVAAAVAAVVVGAVVTGRHLLSGAPASSAGASATAGHPFTPSLSGATNATGTPERSPSAPALSPGHANSAGIPSASGSSAPSDTSKSTSGLPDVPVVAVVPQVVHTATIDMRVGKGKLGSVLSSIATVAGDDGGYVDNSSVSGGSARRSPVAGTMVIRVLDSAFADAIAKVAHLGTVEDQSIQGKDVTIQSAQNVASITVLQDEVNLLEKKLAEASDINTFLLIQNQLLPVEQQLQQLQSAQAVLENSAALATVTVSLTAPGTPVTPAPTATPRPGAAAATVAWRYLRHNSLAVLDGLAVGIGWALPVLVLMALVGLIALRVVRRRRQALPA